MTWTESVNNRVANSFFGRHFQLEGSGSKKERPGSKFLTELRGGLATFVAMVSISKKNVQSHNRILSVHLVTIL
jgi:AGZA family xanthine/uracil permease-like MFS transporter